MSEKNEAARRPGRHRAYSFEIILNGKPQELPVPSCALDEIRRLLCETMSFYYLQHMDEYRKLLSSGNAHPIEAQMK